MVRSESADEELMLSSGKGSGNEEDDEYLQWSHSVRRASSSFRNGEDETSPGGAPCSLSGGDENADRRMRRQIANCNERRRMQSINAGFQSLRSLLPKRDGEKMSKAAILQHTAELIQTLQTEKLRLIEEKEAAIQAKKRKLEEEEACERSLVDELTMALEQERRLRQMYEQQLRERQVTSPVVSPLTTASMCSLGVSFSEAGIARTTCDFQNDRIRLLQRTAPVDNIINNGSHYIRLDAINCPPVTIPSPSNGMECRLVCNKPATESMPQQTLLMNSMENHSTANLSHRNLNAILEAIRHLEGGSSIINSSSVQQTSQQSNVLVR